MYLTRKTLWALCILKQKFITANENNEFIVSEDDKEAIEILERAADTFKV